MNFYFVYYETKDGRTLRKSVRTQTREEAQKKLEEQGYKVIEVTLGQRSLLGFRQKKPSLDEVAGSAKQLGILLKSGLPLLKALGLLQRNARPSLWWIFNRIQDEIKEGASFSDALANYPEVFDYFFVNMVRAAEETGRLEEVLERISSVLEFRARMRRVLVSAIAYPAFILFFSLMLTLMMTIIFAPRLQIFYRSVNTKMPWITEVFVQFGTGLTNHGIAISMILIGLGVVFVALLKGSSTFQNLIKNFLLLLPLLGSIYYKSELAKIVWAMGDLTDSGITVSKALATARNVTTLPKLQNALDKMDLGVSTGQSLAESMENTGVIDPMVVSLTSTGEESGSIGRMLLDAANILRIESEQMAEKAGAILQPFLLLFCSLVVSFIVFNFYYPMFNVLSKVR